MGRLSAAKELEWYELIIGGIALIYGITKITLGFMALFLPKSIRNKYPGLKFLLSSDTTSASKIIEVVLIVFGIYSLLNALDMLGYIHLPWLNTRTFIYSFYSTLGIILIVFYYFVVYTTAPIQKDSSDTYRYKILGLVGGMLFLLMTPIFILYYQWQDHGFHGAITHGIVRTSGAFAAALFLVVASILISIRAKRDTPAYTAAATDKQALPQFLLDTGMSAFHLT